jgi:capsular exopolysaccharide synthesis family protein
VISVDHKRLAEQRLVNGQGSAALGDVFRILRTHVVRRMHALGVTTLAITSPGMSEGKTLIAANLAISLSQFARNTVLLVDLDLRRPSVHDVFSVDAEPGLTDYLLHDVPLAECLVNPGIERLVLLPSGAPLRASSETLSSDKMAALATELKHRYPDRTVIYDLPPLLPTDDAMVFLKHVDGSLLVIEEGRTQRADIERAIELLKDHQMIGTVLNKARWAQRSSGYGY